MAKTTYMTPKGCTLIGFTAMIRPYDGDRFFKLAAPVDDPDVLDALAAQIVEDDDRKQAPASPLKLDEKTGRKYLRFTLPEKIVPKEEGEVIYPKITFIGANGKVLKAEDVPSIVAEGSEVRVKFGARQTTYDKAKTNHLKLSPYKVQLINAITVLEDNDFDDETSDDEDMGAEPEGVEEEEGVEGDEAAPNTNF